VPNKKRVGQLLKERMSRDWIICIDHHFQENGSKLTGHECITKLSMGLWDHMDCIGTHRNNIYHENNNQKVVRYKIEALYRRYKKIWENHVGLIERLHAFRTKDFEDRKSIGN
jgi:hypothetical protein